MNSLHLLIIISALLFLFIILSGVIIGKSGKPYKTTILALHKLASLAFLLLVGFIIYAYNNSFGLLKSDIIIIITGGISLIATFGTGGKLTVGEEVPKKLQIGHKMTSLISLLLIGFLFYRFFII